MATLAVGWAGEEELQPIAITVPDRTEPVDFSREIYPILKKNCIACHNASKAKAKLNLETPEAILKGGSEGPAVVPGKSEESLLLILSAHQDEPVMPPTKNKSNAVPMTPEELGLLSLWIDQGAKGESTIFADPPEEWQAIPDFARPIYTSTLSPDGRFAACGRANQIFIYDVATGRKLPPLDDPALSQEKRYGGKRVAHLDMVQSLAFGPDGTLASGGYRQVKLWQREAVADDPAPEDLTVLPGAMKVSPDGWWVAYGFEDGWLSIQSLKGFEEIQWKTPHGSIRSVDWSPDGREVFTLGEKGFSLFHPEQTPGEARVVDVPSAPVAGCLVEGLVAVGGEDGVIRLWKREGDSKVPVREIKTGKMVGLAAAGKGAILSGHEDGMVRLWQTGDGKTVAEMKLENPVRAVAASRDGRFLAATGPKGVTRL
ncbi:MAG: c-type cytochrome domain-containing protein, partial [Verrucomicrobiota bacterium]